MTHKRATVFDRSQMAVELNTFLSTSRSDTDAVITMGMPIAFLKKAKDKVACGIRYMYDKYEEYDIPMFNIVLLFKEFHDIQEIFGLLPEDMRSWLKTETQLLIERGIINTGFATYSHEYQSGCVKKITNMNIEKERD